MCLLNAHKDIMMKKRYSPLRNDAKLKKALKYAATSLLMSLSFAITPLFALDEEPIIFGTSFRLAEQSRDLSKAIMSKFCQSENLSCDIRFLPQERLNRDFSLNIIDILLFRDHVVDDRHRQTSYPFAATTLLAIEYPKAENKTATFTTDGINPQATIAWQRGDNLEGTLNFQGSVIEIEGFEQGLQLVRAGRISAYFEWNTEILIRTTYEDLSQQGFILTPIIEDVPLYPMRNLEEENIIIIDLLSQWYIGMHEKGELLPIYERFGLKDAYPFHKNWQKWLKD